VSDPIGDSGPAPDISTIKLTHDKSGKVTWTVKFANRSVFITPDFFQIIIDADLRADTGDDGFEWLIQAEVPFGAGLFHWNGSAYDKVDADLTLSTTTSGEVTAQIDFRAFDSETLRFWIYADTKPVESDNFSDEAPASPASYLYQALVPLLLDSFVPPKTVKSGKRLSLNLAVWTDDETSPAISCRARMGRKPLSAKPTWLPISVPSPEPAVPGPLSQKGKVSCNLTVPRNSRGKTISVTMVLTKEGETLREVFSRKIR
jgi:hypothetical protein